MAQAIAAADNPYLELVPAFTIGRLDIHRRILDSGGEGDGLEATGPALRARLSGLSLAQTQEGNHGRGLRDRF